jgi:hypothetical protein
MQALAERLANQEKVKDATQRAYLPQAELDELSETHTWLRESFGLTAFELRQLLALATDGIGDEVDDDEDQPEGDEDSPTPLKTRRKKMERKERTRCPSKKLPQPPR